jgi:uncharacterized lipoprotein YbaY
MIAVASLAAVSGCGQMDFTPESDPARVLAGQIEMADASPLPDDAIVTVRVVDADSLPPDVLGSQTITHPGSSPVSFRVEFRADDEILRRGLNIEARISFGGKMQYFNKNRYAVHLGNVGDTHRINVDRSGP